MLRTKMIAAVLFGLTAVVGAEAAPVLIQPLQPAFEGEFSNLGPSNQQIADDFHLAAAMTLDSVQWYGGYSGDVVGVDPGDFSIRIFADIGGSPAVVPLHTVDVVADAVPTGLSLGSVEWFSYSSPLAIPLGPGTYWISVLENDVDTPLFAATQWLWADASTAGVRSFRLADGAAWTSSFDVNHALTLSATAVPEPPTVALAVLGSIGLAARRWRWRDHSLVRRVAGL